MNVSEDEENLNCIFSMHLFIYMSKTEPRVVVLNSYSKEATMKLPTFAYGESLLMALKWAGFVSAV